MVLDEFLAEDGKDSLSEEYASAPDILNIRVEPCTIIFVQKVTILIRYTSCQLTKKSLKAILNQGVVVSNTVYNSTQAFQTTVN